MHHVAVNDAVENVFANETKGAVDSLQSTVGVVPSIGFEMLVIGVSVVEVCNRHCVFLFSILNIKLIMRMEQHLPNQLLTHMYGTP